LMQSLSNPALSMGKGLFFLPRGFSATAYSIMLRDPMIWSGYRNSIFVTLIGTFLTLTMTFLAAFPLSRTDLKGRNAIQYFIFFTMLFSGGLVPTYLVVNGLGLTNTRWSLIIPNALGAYSVFVLRNFISQIPASLQESAQIDGANDGVVLVNIIVPLSKPIIAVLGLMNAVGRWNSWLDTIIYISNTNLYPLSPIIRQINIVLGQGTFSFSLSDTDAAAFLPNSVRMATVMIATVPVLCIYPFLQKHFVKGIVLGAVKG